jgi:hypothetical protein
VESSNKRSKLNIITDNKPRDIIFGYELSEKERDEFDYINWQEVEAGEQTAEFVRYKGELYDLHDMEVSRIEGWDSMLTDTFFSGILVKYCNDFESVIMGRFYA